MSRKHLKSASVNQPGITSEPGVFFQNGYCKGKETRHGYMLYNPNDYIGKVLDVYGEWSFAEIDILSKLLKPGSLVLDIGAYIGTHSLSFSRIIGIEGFVISFEPQRVAFEFLCANIALNNLLNVFPINAAVSDTKGELIIPIVNPNSDSNTAALRISGYSSGDRIHQITVDSLNLNRCNLMKIDVEGMEINVIKGAQNTIEKYRPILFLENNGFGDSKELIKQLLDLNYQCWWFFSPPPAPNTPFNPEINDKNMLCLPSEWKTNVVGLVPVTDENDTGILAYKRLIDNNQH